MEFDPAMTELVDAITKHPPREEDGTTVEAFMTKFVLIAEWVDPSGAKYLVRRVSPDTAGWDYKGLLHEALFGIWNQGM